jgi:hypothetical protein
LSIFLFRSKLMELPDRGCCGLLIENLDPGPELVVIRCEAAGLRTNADRCGSDSTSGTTQRP